VVTTGIGDHEHLGWATSAALAHDALITRHQHAVSKKVIEVTAYGSGRQVKLLREISGGRRAVLEDRGGHALTGRRVVNKRHVVRPGVFHKTSVPLFTKHFQRR